MLSKTPEIQLTEILATYGLRLVKYECRFQNELYMLCDDACNLQSDPLSFGTLYATVAFLSQTGHLSEGSEKSLKEAKEAGSTRPAAEIDDVEFCHYLRLFQQKVPECSELGVDLQIDQERRLARYQYPAGKRRPIYYEISQFGYKKFSDTLYALRKSRREKSDG